MDFAELVEERHSIRAFEGQEVEREKLGEVLEAARRAPSAGNLQAYKVAVVRAPLLRRRLARAALDQDFVAQAPVVLVFLADPLASGVKYGRRGQTLYAIQDASIACAYAQLAACDAGLGSCWVGAFHEDEARAALGLGQDLRPVALLPLGYPAEVPEITSRRPLAEMVLDTEPDG
jgi:nitroreductase